MTRNTLFNLIALISLSATVGCGTGDNIAGEWEGEINLGGYPLDVSFELEHDSDNTYTGEGETEWFCYISSGDSGYWDDCMMDFEINAETTGEGGEQEIEFELDDCVYQWQSQSLNVDCPSDFELDWDGEDEMEGDLDSDIEMDIERN
jgi:hypothetical protein